MLEPLATAMAHVRTNQTPALRATTVILVQLRTTVGPTKRVLVYPTDVKHRGSARPPTEPLATVMAHVPTHQPPAPPATTGILVQRLTSVGLIRRALVQLTRVTHRDSARLVLVQPVTAMDMFLPTCNWLRLRRRDPCTKTDRCRADKTCWCNLHM